MDDGGSPNTGFLKKFFEGAAAALSNHDRYKCLGSCICAVRVAGEYSCLCI